MVTTERDSVVRTNEVAALKVEAVEFVAGLLRIHYILIDHKCCSLGSVGDALSDLAVIRVSISILLCRRIGYACDP